MCVLFVHENGAHIRISNNRIVVEKEDTLREFPIEMVEAISITGMAQITTQAVKECLNRNIPISYLSCYGKYYGNVSADDATKVSLKRKQCMLYDSEFALSLSKRILSSKVHNQKVVLRRYAYSGKKNIEDIYNRLSYFENKIVNANNMRQVVGYEGISARIYFEGLNRCIEEEFVFKERSRHPAHDAFNSMLNYGYTILYNKIHSIIDSMGLCSYFGFIHRDSDGHFTLVSDLMEEWRAVIIDSTVMSMINGHEVSTDSFSYNEDKILMNSLTISKLSEKIETKFITTNSYLSDFPITFEESIYKQIKSLVVSIVSEDANNYTMLRIR